MKSHVNIMDSDTAYENVIVYHGSDHILKEPIYQGGKTDNDYGNGFYTTEYKDRAKSWAVLNGDPEYSFVKPVYFEYFWSENNGSERLWYLSLDRRGHCQQGNKPGEC